MRYSPSEVQNLLEIPDSTLRRLARDFSDLLSPKQGSKRQYSERDVSTLRMAREMLSKGLSTKEAKIELAKIVDLTQEEPAQESALAPISKQLSHITSELERLRAERQLDHERINELEAKLEALNLPWWKRIFSQK